MQKLTIIVPAYNEKENIRPFYEAVEPFLKNKEYESKYLFIDDGSYDGTLEEIKKLREEDSRVNFISFSRNCGKEAAMQAGLKASLNEDCVIMMDSDLQHPPYLIEEMLKKREEGYKIVYTRQKSRKGDKGSNRLFAHMFYAIFNKYSDVGIEQSVKDYMLLDKAVVKAFVDMPDEYRFTRGIFSYVGFKKTCLEFDFVKREKGKTKWNFGKLLRYGVNGLNQFSNVFIIIPVVAGIFAFLAMVASLVLFLTHIFGLEGFLILLISSFLFFLTDLILYFTMMVLYSTRREVIHRPLYLMVESSLDE